MISRRQGTEAEKEGEEMIRTRNSPAVLSSEVGSGMGERARVESVTGRAFAKCACTPACVMASGTT